MIRLDITPSPLDAQIAVLAADPGGIVERALAELNHCPALVELVAQVERETSAAVTAALRLYDVPAFTLGDIV